MFDNMPLIMARCLILTIVMELTFAIILGIRNKKDILNVILVQVLTNPIVVTVPYLIYVEFGICPTSGKTPCTSRVFSSPVSTFLIMAPVTLSSPKIATGTYGVKIVVFGKALISSTRYLLPLNSFLLWIK